MKRIVSIAAFLFVMAALVVAQDIPKVINGGLLNGKAIKLPKPEYPEEAKKAGIGALVSVRVTIDEDGNVISAQAPRYKTEANEFSPEVTNLHNLLGEAAENAALSARFSPTFLNGQPAKVTGHITYNFIVGGDELDDKALKGGILNGKAVELPPAKYPPAARAVKASGAVTVQVLIDENGDVVSAVAMSGHPLLRAAATEAARNAKFSPTFVNGPAVKVSGVLTYNFVLPDPNHD